MLENVQRRCLQIVLGTESKGYESNLARLSLSTLATRRLDLVKSFAIGCYRSQEHRWWFTPHPPLPLNTRLVPPRFLVPYSHRDRDIKRPIVAYTEVLNNLTEEEWKSLKLPPPTSA